MNLMSFLTYPLERVGRRKSKKKRKPRPDDADGARVNLGYEQNEADEDKETLQTNGKKMGIAAHLRSSLTSLTAPFTSKNTKSQKVLTSMNTDPMKTMDERPVHIP